MKVQYSKAFTKAVDRLNGKIHKSVISAIQEVKNADSINQISACKKIESLDSVYRIRIGSLRAFFVLHIVIDGDVAKFEYLVSRGEAYDRKNMERLRLKDIPLTDKP